MSKGFDTKVAVIIREDLPVWKKPIVTAFAISGIAGSTPEAMGEPYADAERIRTIYMRTREHGLSISLFTKELFTTGCDQENRAAVKAVSEAELDMVGMAMADTFGVATQIGVAMKNINTYALNHDASEDFVPALVDLIVEASAAGPANGRQNDRVTKTQSIRS